MRKWHLWSGRPSRKHCSLHHLRSWHVFGRKPNLLHALRRGYFQRQRCFKLHQVLGRFVQRSRCANVCTGLSCGDCSERLCFLPRLSAWHVGRGWCCGLRALPQWHVWQHQWPHHRGMLRLLRVYCATGVRLPYFPSFIRLSNFCRLYYTRPVPRWLLLPRRSNCTTLFRRLLYLHVINPIWKYLSFED